MGNLFGKATAAGPSKTVQVGRSKVSDQDRAVLVSWGHLLLILIRLICSRCCNDVCNDAGDSGNDAGTDAGNDAGKAEDDDHRRFEPRTNTTQYNPLAFLLLLPETEDAA